MVGCKLSVIIPIYRSELYLERCCQSLFEQSLEEIEYLFIIDGHSDEAEAIIDRVSDEYPNRKKGVRIIRHEQNQGISVCRQEGHDLVTGKYIFHCDSDDWVEPDALQLLVEKAEEEQADIVFFDYVRHYGEKGVRYRAEQVLDGVIQTIDAPLHNKLIRTDLIRMHQLRFPEGINWGEDLCMSVLCQMLSEKIVYLPQCLYHRSMHDQSFTAQVSKDKYMQLVACPHYIETELLLRGLADQYKQLLMQMKFEMKEYLLIKPQLRDFELWKSLYPECHSSIWQYTSVPVYLKGVASMVCGRLSWLAYLLLLCRDQINRVRNI